MSAFLRRSAVAIAMFATAVPGLALAHNGLIHEGCDPAATFSTGPIAVSGAFTRAMLPGARSAGGFLTVTNSGAEADTLTGVASEAAGLVQLHEMTMAGETMKMAPVEGGIVVPAGGSVTLAPGGLHVMFMGIPVAFEEGECVEVVLTFAHSGDLPVVLAIGDAAADAPAAAQVGMGMPHAHK